MDWTACMKNTDLVKEVKIDKNLIASLLKSSHKKAYSQELLELSDYTAGSKITLSYDALRELLEALALSKGYKIYNHECYRAFLKEVLMESALGDEFDGHRKIRNSVNYYGKDVSAQEAKPVIEKMAAFAHAIRKRFFADAEQGQQAKL